jgi:hypothetical protein
MTDPELQKLLTMALESGDVSDKAREILHKKALALGQDIDELDMIIESEISKLKSKEEPDKPSEKQENISCPNCGANIPRSSIKCGFCDLEISKTNITGEKYIAKLQEMLEESSSSVGALKEEMMPGARAKKQVAIINTFNMPNDKANLFELFYFCDSNADSHSDTSRFMNPAVNTNRILGPAWSGKAQMAYNKLQRFAKDDEDIRELTENYRTKYYVAPDDMEESPVKKFLRENSKFKSYLKWIFIALIVLWVLKGCPTF